jgi:hypothetical protein
VVVELRGVVVLGRLPWHHAIFRRELAWSLLGCAAGSPVVVLPPSTA